MADDTHCDISVAINLMYFCRLCRNIVAISHFIGDAHTGNSLVKAVHYFVVPASYFGCEADHQCTVYPKKYAHGFCFAVFCCGYTLTDFPISIRLTSLALWQSNDCPSASKATLMNMDKYLMWIHYERLHNQNKAKHNKTVCIFLGIYCSDGMCALVQ